MKLQEFEIQTSNSSIWPPGWMLEVTAQRAQAKPLKKTLCTKKTYHNIFYTAEATDYSWNVAGYIGLDLSDLLPAEHPRRMGWILEPHGIGRRMWTANYLSGLWEIFAVLYLANITWGWDWWKVEYGLLSFNTEFLPTSNRIDGCSNGIHPAGWAWLMSLLLLRMAPAIVLL